MLVNFSAGSKDFNFWTIWEEWSEDTQYADPEHGFIYDGRDICIEPNIILNHYMNILSFLKIGHFAEDGWSIVF